MTETKEYGSLREKIAAEKAERLARYAAFETLWSEAVTAGLQAGYDVVPTPMIVSGYENDPVMDGVCGFGWIAIRPGSASFARWLVSKGLASKSYYGGVRHRISAHGQSYTRKVAHAQAMVDVLTASPLLKGVRIYAGGDLD